MVRISANTGKAGGPVILRNQIARFASSRHIVAVKAGVGQGLGEGKEVFARGQLHLLFAEQLIIAIEAHGGGLRLVRLSEDLDLERLALFDAARQAKFLHRNIAPLRHAQRAATSIVTPSGFAAKTAPRASPMFSLPSDMITSRFCPVSGKAAVPSRIAPAISVRSVPTTAWIFSTLTMGLIDDSMLASLPKTRTPARSTLLLVGKSAD